MKHFLKETISTIILYFSLEVIMKRINAWRGQRPRGIKTGNTTGIGFGGIVWRVPTILMVLLLGSLLIACQEAKPSSKSNSKPTPTLATATTANVITAKWPASEGANGYIVKVTNDQGAEVFSDTVASETNKQEYTLEIKLPKGTYTVTVYTEKKPDEAIAKSNAIEISTEAIVAVYKTHNSKHRTTFSLGDYNDPELFKIGGLKDGSKPHYEIKVSAGSTSIYTLAKTQIAEKVPSSGENKGSVYVGLAMKGDSWRGITDDSEVTITLTVYDDAGTTELFKETITPKKSPDGSIYSWRGLQNMQDDMSGSYKLENDIEFPEPNTKGFVTFTPIGSTATPFIGSLDGNNKKVHKLYINNNSNNNTGLFDYVKAITKTDVVVKDLWLVNPKITLTKKAGGTGALIGNFQTGTVTNVHVQGGTVTSKLVAGGLVGENRGVVTSSSSSAQVSGVSSVGGLVGVNEGTVRGYATGAVSGGDDSNTYTGGLVGNNEGTVGTVGTVTGYATGAVSGYKWVGGLVGRNEGTVRGYATGVVSGNKRVGGLVGENNGTITGSKSTITGYATGAVSGNEQVGGLVGNNYGGTVTGYATGTVSGGKKWVGGLVGVKENGTVRGYALGYVIKTQTTVTSVGPGIGATFGTSAKVYVGRTGTEVEAETAVGGAGDHVGVITTTASATKSDGSAPQGIVIEGSGTNVAADATKKPPIVAVRYSKNQASFTDFTFGTEEGKWTLGTGDNWPTLNFPSDFADGARTQNPSIPTKPTNFQE